MLNEGNFRILRIDAWREPGGGWTWNQWWYAGTVPCEVALSSTRKLLRYLRSEGLLSRYSCGKVAVEDDGYNLVIVARKTREPVFAVEYGTWSDSTNSE